MLKGLMKWSLIGCGSFVVLMVLLVAGLLAWDYVDQKMAERQEQQAAATPSQGGSGPSVVTNPAS